jgi:AbiV family abortive infection protein
MMNGRLEEYRGPLTPAEAAGGMNAARRNAQRLLSDAKLLLDAERYPTAASLAALSIEESGKISILRSMVIDQGAKELKEEWRRYRDHRSKNGAWILPELFMNGAKYLFDLFPTVDRDSEHTATLNSIKQIGLYTDCYVRGYWSEPEQVVDADLARSLVKIAELLICNRKPVTVREMELWAEFLGPSWRTPDMPHALVKWATAMYREGLIKTTPEEYSRFVFGGSDPTDKA